MPSFLLKIVGSKTTPRTSIIGCPILRAVKGGVLLAACIAASIPSLAHAQPSTAARAHRATLQYRRAEILRRRLLAHPLKARTLGQYNATLNAYRAVYHGDPASNEAPKSIVAVAELLTVEGRQFHNAKYFHDAIAQDEFLRQQYPTSSLRAQALQSELTIARLDLHSPHLTAQLRHAALHPSRILAAREIPEETSISKTSDRVRKNTLARARTMDASDSSADANSNSGTVLHNTPHAVPRAVAGELPSDFMETYATSEANGHSMARVLGLRVHRIVIDAGHGGHDSGTLGPDGLEEKNVVLDVALRLGKLLQDRLGAEVVYTRHSDIYVPLESRTAIANHAHADLFLSIHANSSPDEDARGVETYFLNFTASPSALAVAARENAVSHRSVHDLSDLVRRITLSDKIDESRTFAADVQQSLYQGLERGNPGLHNRGVKQAPFVVLIGANMPSILAEISFLTNTSDAAELRRPAYRQRIAESVYRGVATYVESMGGLRIAENTH